MMYCFVDAVVYGLGLQTPKRLHQPTHCLVQSTLFPILYSILLLSIGLLYILCLLLLLWIISVHCCVAERLLVCVVMIWVRQWMLCLSGLWDALIELIMLLLFLVQINQIVLHAIHIKQSCIMLQWFGTPLIAQSMELLYRLIWHHLVVHALGLWFARRLQHRAGVDFAHAMGVAV